MDVKLAAKSVARPRLLWRAGGGLTRREREAQVRAYRDLMSRGTERIVGQSGRAQLEARRAAEERRAAESRVAHCHDQLA
jgi:hypothetical protein